MREFAALALTLVLLVVFSLAGAQAGETYAPLDAGVGARAMGMAGAVTFLPTEPCDVWWSPLGIARKAGVELGVATLVPGGVIAGIVGTPYVIEEDVFHAFFGAMGVRFLGEHGKGISVGLSGAIAGVELPELPKVSDSGKIIGTFAARAMTAKGGLSLGLWPVVVGANIGTKLWGTDNEEPSRETFADVGAAIILAPDITMSATPPRKLPIRMALGVALRDIPLRDTHEMYEGPDILHGETELVVGGGLKFGDIIGIEVDLLDKVFLEELKENMGDVVDRLLSEGTLRFGAELGLENTFFLRGGAVYNLLESQILSMNFGFELKILSIFVGYTCSLNPEKEFFGVHRFSVGARF